LPQRALRLTLISIVVSVSALIALAAVDGWSEGKAALEDFAEDQAIIARTIADKLQDRLTTVRRDAFLIAEAHAHKKPPSLTILENYSQFQVRKEGDPPLITHGTSAFLLSVRVPDQRVVDLVVPQSAMTSIISSFEKPTSQLVLLLPPAANTFRTVDGRTAGFPGLSRALIDGSTSMRLTREEAASLGLSPRMAVAGLAAIDAGDDLGRWGIATIVSAERLRDRDSRARTRLIFSVLGAGGLVAAFGALALRRQRRELELSRELAVAAIERENEARLDQAGRAATLGTLAMGIAHEISTPASVIHGRAEQLADRVAADERSAAAVRAIMDQSTRISQVVRGFLDLARGDSPRVTAAVPVDELIDGAFDLVEHRFTKARVQLLRDVAENLPVLRGDRRLLEHALTNLLLNACDACSAGGKVEISVRASDADTRVTFVVLDDGVGISAQHAEHVLQPFFTTKGPGKGTGLGLAITTEIVRAHRGTLRLEPRAPRGTCAIITLPVTNGEARA
jgi:two-component system NtrC family sensor kinase